MLVQLGNIDKQRGPGIFSGTCSCDKDDDFAQLGVGIAMFLLFAQAFRIGMMGGGDVKMIAAVALWLPLPSLFRMLLVMSLAGGAVTIAMLVDHRLRVRRLGDAAPAIEVPYGVAIAVAALVVLQEPLFNPFPSI